MEAVIILLLFILVILVLTMRISLHDRLGRIEHEMQKIKEDLKATPPSRVPEPPPTPVSTPPPPAAPRETEPYRAVERPRPWAATPPPALASEPAAPKPVEPPHFQRMDPVEPPAATQRASASTPPVTPPPPAKPGFFEQHPDLEKFIGENLISKIGIAILVLAIGFFVKYAIDNNWIGAVGRVGIGLLCGGILIGIAHRLRNQYKAFSSVLVGGGLAALYFTIALAYHEYHLFNQATTFVIMLVVTAFSVLLSLLYDRQELAIIALVGGFVTPFLVSNGRGDYVVLFSYLLILNSGLLVIAYYKVWRWLNILSFGFTALLFASWLLSLPYDASPATYRGGWGFATAFYLLFFIINIAYTVRKNKPFVASDFGILLANTCLYFAAGLYLIAQLGLDRYKGLYCAVMGIFHLGATWFLFRRSTVDKNILYLLVGLTLSFVSLTAPIQLHGHYITLFWASETVLLYWLYKRSGIRLIKVAAYLIWGAMLVSLTMDWGNIYGQGVQVVFSGLQSSWRTVGLPIVFNKGLMTGLYAALSCWALFYLSQGTPLAKTALLIAGGILFIAGMLEIFHQFWFYYPALDLWRLYVLLYTYLFIYVFAWGSGRLKKTNFRRITAGLLALSILVYLGSLFSVFNIQQYMLETGLQRGHFAAHWGGDLVFALILARLVARGQTESFAVEPVLFTWLICTVTVIFLSAEGQLLINTLFFTRENGLDNLQRVYDKTGLPILWGLCSFAFMWLGMRHKFKPLRIVSLVLFTLTLLKLFLFDIRDIPIAGKIAAFFCLGVLLLVVSFMYQRLKKIIIEDEEKKPI
ncbi:DUF2339 domain-containing protein [Puia dinghuensis]|uniref:Membrane protein n=1 Tax=Puia dinghuensis TaxID=1792502 RepID=A0A8J2UFY1_9BACT|nr:DUF2339 domain-containing protein [Puia dinghuensis]GGB12404.1 membrane protein [Puia dinghuensis]